MKNLRAILVCAVLVLLLGSGVYALLQWSSQQVEYPAADTFTSRTATKDFIERVEDRAQPGALEFARHIAAFHDQALRTDWMRMGKAATEINALDAARAEVFAHYNQASAGWTGKAGTAWNAAAKKFRQESALLIRSLNDLDTAWPAFQAASESLPDEAAQRELSAGLAAVVKPLRTLDRIDYLPLDDLAVYTVERLAALKPALLPLQVAALQQLQPAYEALSGFGQAGRDVRAGMRLRAEGAHRLANALQQPVPDEFTREWLSSKALSRPAIDRWFTEMKAARARYDRLRKDPRSLHHLRNELDQVAAGLNAVPDARFVGDLKTLRRLSLGLGALREREWNTLRGEDRPSPAGLQQLIEAYELFNPGTIEDNPLQAYVNGQLAWLLRIRAGHRLDARLRPKTGEKKLPAAEMKLATLGVKTLGAGKFLKGQGGDLHIECVQGGLTHQVFSADWKEDTAQGTIRLSGLAPGDFSLLLGGQALRFQVRVAHDPAANRNLVPDSLKQAGEAFGQFRTVARTYPVRSFATVDALIAYCGIAERGDETATIDFARVIQPGREFDPKQAELLLEIRGVSRGRDFERPQQGSSPAGGGSLIDAAQELLKQGGIDVDLQGVLEEKDQDNSPFPSRFTPAR